MDYGPIVPASILHVGVISHKEPLSPSTANILRDTNGLPLTDTGWSLITAPPLSSGVKLTPKTTL